MMWHDNSEASVILQAKMAPMTEITNIQTPVQTPSPPCYWAHARRAHGA